MRPQLESVLAFLKERRHATPIDILRHLDTIPTTAGRKRKGGLVTPGEAAKVIAEIRKALGREIIRTETINGVTRYYYVGEI